MNHYPNASNLKTSDTPSQCSQHTQQLLADGIIELPVPTNPVAEQINLFFADPRAWLKNYDAHDFWRETKETNPAAWISFRNRVNRSRPDHKVSLSDLDRLTKSDSSGKPNPSKKIVDQLLTLVEPWKNRDGTTFVSTLTEPRRNFQIESADFKEFAASVAYFDLQITATSDIIKTVQTSVSAVARYEGKLYDSFRRIGNFDGEIFIDTGWEDWSAIRVTRMGWGIETSHSLKFIRSRGSCGLPTPSPTADLDTLWQIVNIEPESHLLVLAWMLECFRSNTPFPVLEIAAEQGSGKSSTQDMLRRFIDPNAANLRSAPRDERDWVATSRASHLISLENLSGLSASEQDLICRISTGAAVSGRQLYTDSDEVIHHLHNPVILNGIVECCTRPDLLDRAIVICPPPIKSRVTKEEIESLFGELSGKIMTCLLDLLVQSLNFLPNVRINPEDRPRMADFCIFGEAMAQSLGYQPNHFLKIYTENRKNSVSRTIDSSPVAQACIKFVEAGMSHTGTVGTLLSELSRFVDQSQIERTDYWPKSPRGLSASLKRYTPALRQLGVLVELESLRKRDGFHCTLKKADSTYQVEVRI